MMNEIMNNNNIILVNHHQRNRLLTMTRRKLSHDFLLLQQRRHRQQQMLMTMMMRKRKRSSSGLINTTPRRRSVVHHDNEGIVTPQSNSLAATTLKTKSAVDVAVTNDNDVPTMIAFRTTTKVKSLSSSPAIRSQVDIVASSSTRSHNGKRRNQIIVNKSYDDDDTSVLGMDAATTITMTTSSLSNNAEDTESMSSDDDEDDAFLLASHEKRMAFYRRVQTKLCQSNVVLNQIGVRTIQYEIQRVQEAFRQVKMIHNKASHVELSSVTHSYPCKKRKIDNGNSVPDIIHSHDNNTEKKHSMTSSSLSLTTNMITIEPDVIPSHDDHTESYLFSSLLLKRKQQQQQQQQQQHLKQQHLKQQHLKQQHLKQRQMMLYQRARRMKHIAMLFRNMNTYQRTLYWEIQSCINNEMKIHNII